jgi:lipopolysaccharide biosynthesis glycosyltransferase
MITETKHLVYMISMGSSVYHQMTRLCIQSLRQWGKFTGDLVVFTDQPRNFSNLGVTTFSVPAKTTSFEIKLLKSKAAEILDVHKYSNVAFLDSDMIVLRNINSLFCARGSSIACASEFPFHSMLHDVHGSSLLRFEERERAKLKWGLNSGFVAMQSKYFRSNMRIWSNAIIRYRAYLTNAIDQPCLNILVFRGKLRATILPRHAIVLPLMYAWVYRKNFRITAATKMLHLIGADKEACLRAMRSIHKYMEERPTNKQLESTIRVMLQPYSVNPSLS